MPISFGGLASGFDTTSIISQLISLEARPITLLSSQRSNLQQKIDAFKELNTLLSSLEDAAFGLTQSSNLTSRNATSSDKNKLLVTASPTTNTGTYAVDILQLATASQVDTGTGAGQGNTFGGVADLTNFSANTVAQINAGNRLKTNLTTGTFFVNGQQITVTNTKTLDDLLTEINTATGGAVSGSLVMDPAKNGLVLELSSASPITLASGTSNFLQAFKLDTASYSAGTLVSSDAVNGVKTTLKLDGSEGATNLAQNVGSGTLTINGVDIDYDESTDTLQSIVSRINAANTQVTAAFSGLGSGELQLRTTQLGPQAINIQDTGNLANALGLLAADAQTLGQSAQIQVNGGATQYFNSNKGISAVGLEGMTLDLLGTQTGLNITIDTNTTGAVGKVNTFIERFNALITKVNDLTRYDQETKTAGLLLTDSAVVSVRDSLFRMLFGQVGGLTDGTNNVGTVAELGISTGPIGSAPGTTSALQLDAKKLQDALNANPERVAQIFGASDTEFGTTGVFKRIKDHLDGLSNASGIFVSKQKTLTNQIASIDQRILSLNERLTSKQAFLENQFNNLELVLSRMQSQQSALSGLLNSLR